MKLVGVIVCIFLTLWFVIVGTCVLVPVYVTLHGAFCAGAIGLIVIFLLLGWTLIEAIVLSMFWPPKTRRAASTLGSK